MKLNTNIIILSGFIFLLFFKLSSFAQTPQQEHLERNIKIIYPGQTYVSKDEFLCGKTAIVITSTCISYDVESSDSYCFSQVASFVNIEKRQTKSFFIIMSEITKYLYMAQPALKTKINYLWN